RSIVPPPYRGRANQRLELGLKTVESVTEPGDMGIEMGLQPEIAEQAPPVLFGGEHVDELPAPRHQFAQRPRLRAGHGPGDGANRFGKERDDPSSSPPVLANWPVAPAKSRTGRGLITATGRSPPARAAATMTSYPPVASRTTTAGFSGTTRASSVANPASSWLTRKDSPRGRTDTSRWAFETSMPTKQGCSMTRPCECGLCRPKR